MKIASLAIGQYIPGRSPLHRMDPRSKIIMMTVMVACLFMIKSAWGYAAIAVILMAGIISSKVGLRFIMRSMRSLLGNNDIHIHPSCFHD